ncbi:hypothetical protein BGZ94_003406, partial [Podila epigama]
MAPLSSLTKDQIRDRVRGCLIGNQQQLVQSKECGNAVGDAYGLASEFMLKRTAVELYGNGPIAFGFAPGYPVWEDSHRSISERNDFTDDTDQMLLLLQSLEQTGDGTLHPVNFAKKMAEWNDFGFPELGTPARGIGFTVGQVMDHPEFRRDPFKAAFEIWDAAGRNLAPNGAVMRTAVVGIESFWDEPRVVQNGLAAAKITHADPRSIVSAVVSSVLISRLLRGGGQDPEQDTTRVWNSRLKDPDYRAFLLAYLRRGSYIKPQDEQTTNPPVFEDESAENRFRHKDFHALGAERLAHEAIHPPNRPEPHNVHKWNENRPTAVPRANIGWAGIDAVGEDTAIGSLARAVLEDYKFLLLEADVVPDLPRSPSIPADFSFQQKWTDELLTSCFPESMDQLELGSASAMGYAYKCIGIAYYGATRKLDPHPDPEQPEYQGPSGLFLGLMEQVTLEGGDADTNAA